jgi:hypothetical protein
MVVDQRELERTRWLLEALALAEAYGIKERGA